MIKAYKHVKHAYADVFESGRSVRIGSLDAYRKMEGDRADQLEGKAGYFIDKLSYSDSGIRTFNITTGKPVGWADVERSLMKIGMRIGRDAKIRNIEISKAIKMDQVRGDFYIFCLSSDPDISRKNEDAIFEITDLKSFSDLIAAASPVPLISAGIKAVEYGDRFISVDNEKPHGPDIFLKDRNFSWEKEIRVAWKVKRPDFQGPCRDYLDVCINDLPQGLVRRIC